MSGSIPANTGYKALIIDTQTGEQRWHEADYPWGEGSEFIWTEGNFACDCNRALFFAWSAGEDDPDVGCGEERYRVPYAVLIPGGERVEIDGQDE